MKLGCNKGSATLETAVMFLILIIMVTGFIFLINAVTVYSVAQTAAREGAREYAITDNASKAARKASTNPPEDPVVIATHCGSTSTPYHRA